MATNFPTSLDALTNPTGTSSLTSPDHAGQHTDANDAIEALQAKVGVNGSAVTTSLDYKVANMLPSGMIAPYAGTTAPSGWQLCDGTGLNSVAQPALFAVIGYTYGGSGGTFNVPDMRTRVPVGLNGSGTFAALNGKGGAETHTLTTTEMPSHTHTQNAHTHTQDAHTHTQNSHNHTQDSHNHTQNAHSHTVDGALVPRGTGSVFRELTDANAGSSNVTSRTATATNIATTATNQAATATNQNTTATNQNTTATNQNTGGGGAHNNLQPYIVLNYIIKL
jgi:microcystin-dependent protein